MTEQQLLSGTRGGPRRTKVLFRTNKTQGTQRGFFTWEGPAVSCLVSVPPFLILLHPEGKRNRTRKGTKLQTGRSIINSAGELSLGDSVSMEGRICRAPCELGTQGSCSKAQRKKKVLLKIPRRKAFHFFHGLSPYLLAVSTCI